MDFTFSCFFLWKIAQPSKTAFELFLIAVYHLADKWVEQRNQLRSPKLLELRSRDERKRWRKKETASAGNRTRSVRMASGHFTIKPLMREAMQLPKFLTICYIL